MVSTQRATFLSVLAILAGFLALSEARAQATLGTISGVVKDETGAVLPGVALEARHLETGIARTAVSDDAGRYRLQQLALGEHETKAELVGFQTAVQRGIKLTVGEQLEVNFVLRVGEITEQVEVSGEAPLVETTTSTISGLIDDRQIRDLPLNGRSVEQLALLQPGVTASRTSGSVTGGVNIGGARRYQNVYLLDGTELPTARSIQAGQSAAGVSLGVDTIKEFRVLVNSFSAEFGQAAGGVISAVTRSGTNELHGSLFEFHRNSALDARNFFDPGSKPPAFRRNQFGFTVGGPIRKNQTFFFGSYEGLRDRLSQTIITNVPTIEARRGVLPSGRVQLNERVVPYLNLLPFPNGRDNLDGTGEFIGTTKTPKDDDYFSVRVDHTLSPRDSLFARYTFDEASTLIPTTVIGLIGENETSRNQYFTLEETRVLSQVLLNIFRVGVTRLTRNNFCEQLKQIPASLNFVPGQPYGTGGGIILTGAGIEGLAGCTSGGRGLQSYNLVQGNDDITWNRGGHSVKTGMMVKNIRWNITDRISWSGEYTFNTLDRFLTGRPNTFRAPFPDADVTRSWRQTLYGFYIQDDFKLGSNLTWNLGLRYEFTTAPSEVHGRSARLLNDMDPSTTVLGRKPFVETSKKDFAPRVGFAWDPWRDGKTAIRGGFGLFFEPVLPHVYAIPGVRQPPFFKRANKTDPPFPNAYEIIEQFPSETTLNNFSPTNTVYTMQLNLNAQREVLRDVTVTLGYVGSRGLHLHRGADHNTAIPTIQADGRKFFPANAQRRNPFIGEHLTITTDAQSWYNGMVLSLRKRFGGGDNFQLSYTLSKTIDEASSSLNPETTATQGRNTMDPEDLKRDRSRSAIHVGQNLVFNSTFELPLGRGKRFGGSLAGLPGRILGGWQTSSILTLASGVPVNVELGFNAARNAAVRSGTFQQRPDLAPGRSNNPVRGGPDQYLDPSAFRVPEAGYYGNLGRNTVSGPGYVNLDFSLIKKTPVTEDVELQFRAEFFNIMNHANLGTPNRIIFNNFSGVPLGSFGRITSTVTTARQIQFALKLIF